MDQIDSSVLFSVNLILAALLVLLVWGASGLLVLAIGGAFTMIGIILKLTTVSRL